MRFALITGSILVLFSVTIYYSSGSYRQAEFYGRLKDRSLNTARLFIEVQEVDSTLLTVINQQNVALPDENISIYKDGHLVYSSTVNPPRFKNPAYVFDRIRESRIVYEQVGRREALGLLYAFDDEEYFIVSSAVDKYGLSKLNNLRLILIIGLVLCLIITVLAALFYASQALKPMSYVIHQVGQITISNLNSRVDEGNKKDEIALLGMTFNQMLERLEAAFQMQKSFVSNASHELRTPLTSISGQLEVILMKDRDVSDYREVLRSVKDDIGNLTKLSNGLLELARLSADSSEFVFSELRIDELLWEARAELLKAHPTYSVNIRFSPDIVAYDLFIISGNEPLLKSAFLNLMDNACKFSADNLVMVTLDIKQDNRVVIFKDNGIGISKEEIRRVSEPFYRSEQARSVQGYGLGLSLTYRIIEHHNGSIDIFSQLTKGSSFIVSLPSVKTF